VNISHAPHESSLSYNAGISFVSNIILISLSVATQSCLAWVLGPADRGSLAVCQVFSLALSLSFVFGLNAASLYFVSSKRFSLSDGITNILIYGGLGSLVAIVVGLVSMQFDFSFFQKASRSSFYLSLATIPTALFTQVLIALFTAIEEFCWYAAMNTLNSLFLLALTAIFVFFFNWGVNGALIATIITGTLSIAIALMLFRIRYGVRLTKPVLASLQAYFSYGIRYHIGKVSNYLNLQMGTMFMAFFASRQEIAFFAIAAQIMSKVFVVSDTLQVVLIPKVASDPLGKRLLIAQCARITFLITAILLMVMALIAKPFVALLFSPLFYNTVPIIRILTIGVLIRCTVKIFEPYLLGTGHPGTISLSSVAVLIANFLLIWILLPPLGVVGAAIGTSIAYGLGGVTLLLSFVKYSRLKLADVLTARKSDLAVFDKHLFKLKNRLFST
jgi:O-antigen/teichoic acid export membrane protein